MNRQLVDFISSQTSLSSDQILLELPKLESQGDFAMPTFLIAKSLKKSPQDVAKELVTTLSIQIPTFIEKVEAFGPYVNFYLNKQLYIQNELQSISSAQDKFLQSRINNFKSENVSKTILIDFSAPNIAKPLSIGHLRNTVIGQFLVNLYKETGHKVIGVNHLGDWGTQFGILAVGFEKYAKKSLDEIKELSKPNEYFVDIYIKINDDIKEEETKLGTSPLRGRALSISKQIEDKKEPYYSLWKTAVECSLKELKKTYEKIHVSFDEYLGESFYEDKVATTIQTLKDKKIIFEDQGAWICDLESEKLGKAVIVRKDGASLYLSRDITAAQYRTLTFKPTKTLYVVGSEQSHHFSQLFSILEKLGYDKKSFEHISYGLLSFKGQKMSTRKGNLIFLDEIVDDAQKIALETINEKSPNLENKSEVSKVIGLGAAFFGDLKHDRMKNVDFDWDKVLDFKGDTSVYLQYTFARIQSMLRKSTFSCQKLTETTLCTQEEFSILKHISNYELILRDSVKHNKSHFLAEYLIQLAQKFNDYYTKTQILQGTQDEQQQKLTLCFAIAQTLKEGLKILNIDTPQQM